MPGAFDQVGYRLDAPVAVRLAPIRARTRSGARTRRCLHRRLRNDPRSGIPTTPSTVPFARLLAVFVPGWTKTATGALRPRRGNRSTSLPILLTGLFNRRRFVGVDPSTFHPGISDNIRYERLKASPRDPRRGRCLDSVSPAGNRRCPVPGI